MILKTYKIKTNYTRIRNNKECSYSRYKTVHDIQCATCSTIFTKQLDKARRGHNIRHMCDMCISTNQIGTIFSLHRKEKEDKSKIGERRLHKNTKYPEIYVGIDSWHTKVQGHWCREHIFVMEEHIGHKIPDGYVVHHIDGDKSNNSIENLVMLTVAEHNNAHAKSELIIFELVKKGLVVFNTVTKLYELR